MSDTPERPHEQPSFDPAPPTEVGPPPAPPTQMAPQGGTPPPAPGPAPGGSPYGQQPFQPAPYQPMGSPYQPMGSPYQPAGPYGGAPSPYQPKGSGGKVALIVVGVIVLVILLFCAGVIGFFVWVVNSVESSIPDDDRVGGPNNPIEVEQGESFTIDDFEFEADWQIVEAEEYGTTETDIAELSAENTGDTAEDLYVTFTFVLDDQELGEIRCSSDGNIQPGRSETFDCSPDYDGGIEGYDAIEVGASW